VIFSVLSTGDEAAVLWLISNSRDADNYEIMLRYVNEMAEYRFKPTSVVIGADSAFRDAFAVTYPSCTLLAPNVIAPASPSSSYTPDLATSILSSLEKPAPTQ